MANTVHLQVFLGVILFFIARIEGQIECGDITSEKEYTFWSPSTYVPKCTLRVYVTDSKVTQLRWMCCSSVHYKKKFFRLDFKSFSIAPPEKPPSFGPYQCLRDSFTIESLSKGDSSKVLLFDTLCGENSGQHIYVPVNAAEAPDTIQLTFDLQQPDGDMKSQEWSIKVTQLDCNDIYDKELCAPEGCLQYYPDRYGTFESFNYNNGAGHYQGFLSYAICFKRYRSVCSIEFDVVGFQLAANDFIHSYGNRGCNVPTNDTTDPYSRDFLFIPDAYASTGVASSLWCGTSLLNNIASTSAPGPFYVFFQTDEYAYEVVNGKEVGFRIRYYFDECSSNMEG